MEKKLVHLKLALVLCLTKKGGYFIGDYIDNYGDGEQLFVYNRQWITRTDETDIVHMWNLSHIDPPLK